MDSFERAHVPRKSDKLQNKTVKAQYKQMLNAYKKGDNAGIRSSSEIIPNWDIEDTFNSSATSESPELNITAETEEVENELNSVLETEEAEIELNSFLESEKAGNELNSVPEAEEAELELNYFLESEEAGNELNSVPEAEEAEIELNSFLESEEAGNELNSVPEAEEAETESNSIPETWEDIYEDAILVCLPSGSSSVDIMTPSNNLSNLSIELPDSDLSGSNLLSQSSSEESIENDSENKQFDAEGILASKIKEKLNQNFVNFSIENRPDDKLKKKLTKQEANTKKKGKPKEKDKDHFLSGEYYGDDGSWKEVIKGLDESKMACPKKSKKKSSKNKVPSDRLDGKHTSKILRSEKNHSPSFVSVCAVEPASVNLELNEIIGQYIHPTTRNIYLEELHLVSNTTLSDVFPANMHDEDLDRVTVTLDEGSDDEMNSLLPEVDQDLSLDDLNIEESTYELTENSQQTSIFNDSVSTEIDHSILSNEAPTESEYVQMKLYNGNDNFILVMRHPTELFIHGKVQICDFNGSSEILGYKLNCEPVDVFAPYSHHAQCLKTSNTHHPFNSNLGPMLMSAGLTVDNASEILAHYSDEETAVVQLRKLDSPTLDYVGSNFCSSDLFSRRGENIPQFLRKAAQSLGCSLYLKPPKKSFEEKKIWEEVYSSIICRKEQSRGIICGGKNMGKSTFLRHYVNTMLADGPILVLDLDPGQAEFSVAGNVSATVVNTPLIGPSFTHLRTPELMLNIGMVNTMDNAKRYLAAVTQVISYCRTSLSVCDMPWIINTMGMCNNMGLKFMTYIILLVQPTFLFQIDSKMPKKSFGFELDPITVTQLYEKNANNALFEEIQNPYCLHYSFIISRPDSSPPLGNESASNLLSRDERYLNILAYFGELFEQYAVNSLLDILPFEVNIKDLSFGLNVKIPENTLAQVVNGKIVALCHQEKPDNWQFTLGDNALRCYGHGLIRNIDYESGILYILTPVPIQDLSVVNTLVYSDWMPELRGSEKAPLPNGTSIPYRTSSTELHQRRFMFAPRRRFNPLQLVKMSRNT